MAGLRIDSGDLRRVLGTLLVGIALAGAPACRQMPPGAGSTDWTLSNAGRQGEQAPSSTAGRQSPLVRGQSPSLGPLEGALSWPPPEAASGQKVLDVQIVGAGRTPKAEIRRLITTRPGRPFDPERIYEDVRRLSATHKFVDIRPYYREMPGGCAVIFEVRERPIVEYVRYVGNLKYPKKTLEKEAGIKVGDPLDPFTVDGGRQRLEEFYREKGFFKARVTIFEGKQEGDRGVVYQINEGESPRILWTSFVGNTIASDAKLRTKIQSKPGFLWIFKGEVNREQIDADRERLVNYYRSLGYYRARVGHPILEFDARRKWLVLTFVIDEGPRFEVRRVSFVGNTKFTSDELAEDLSLKSDQFFRQADMQSDLNTIADKYGAIGYVFADVIPDVRLLKPGQLDVVYQIAEGERCYVGRIEPKILGEGSHTSLSTILNRLSFYPGEPVDIREVRASERRLKFSGLFEVDPRVAPAPRIVVHLPDLEDAETSIVRQPRQPGQSRGQSPDRRPAGFQSPSVVRGQFSAEAGQSVPPLRRPGSLLDQPPSSYPPAESYSGRDYAIRDDGATRYDAPGWGGPMPGAETANRLGPDVFPPLGDPLVAGPPVYVPIDPEVYEGRTGKLMFSVAVNSEAGLLGSFIYDEQNFDWTRLPTSWDDIRNGTAWRGDGQRLRIEAVPGTRLHKYSATFQEPYWFDTQVSLSLSGYFYNRRYQEWDEEQLGGRVGLGYRFTNDLSGVFSFRGTKIQIFDPIVPTPAELTEVLGENALYGFRVHLAHDTRDHAFLPTEGHLFEIGAEHVLGSFDYTRGDVDIRKYFMLRQHPDGTGRHVLSLNTRASITGSQTPIYEHYYAGGFSTIRGFDFREASPRDPATGAVVGGHFMLLASAEYMFPLTADDNLRGVVFCDTGTVEPTIDHWTDDYRVAAGFGLRILVPGMGQAPIALDFAVPLAKQAGDDEQVFSFFIGFFR